MFHLNLHPEVLRNCIIQLWFHPFSTLLSPFLFKIFSRIGRRETLCACLYYLREASGQSYQHNTRWSPSLSTATSSTSAPSTEHPPRRLPELRLGDFHQLLQRIRKEDELPRSTAPMLLAAIAGEAIMNDHS